MARADNRRTAWDRVGDLPDEAPRPARVRKAAPKKPMPPPRIHKGGSLPDRIEAVLRDPQASRVASHVDDGRDVRQRFNDGVYASRLPYPKRTNFPLGTKDPGFISLRSAYSVEAGHLREQLKQDLFAENGVTGNPKAQRAWEIAYDERHSSGLGEVIDFFNEIVELIR